jgi:tRNA(fMet)-specific endonuclease VapC
MTQSVLIDTNIVSAHFKGDPVVESKLLLAEMIYLPSIVLGELYFGANRSSNPSKNIQRIERFLFAVFVLSIDSDTPNFYGDAKADLSSRGLMIPDNDLSIAAISLQHDLVLVTRDHHFDHLQNLKKTVW